jgi:hypothetical protein
MHSSACQQKEVSCAEDSRSEKGATREVPLCRRVVSCHQSAGPAAEAFKKKKKLSLTNRGVSHFC